MKITKLNSGHLIITEDDGTIKYLLPKEIIIKVNPDQTVPESILINNSTTFDNSGRNSIHVALDSISEINGEVFSGDITDLVIEIDTLASGVKLSEDYISVKRENEYEAFVDFSNRKKVLLVETTIVGDLISKLYHQTSVIDTAAFDILWGDRDNLDYVNLVDL